MKVWIVEISDFLPEIDGNNRLYRVRMLAKTLVNSGHRVLWWTSTAYLKWGLKIAGRKASVWDKQFFLGAEIKSDTNLSLDEIKSIPVLERLLICKPVLIITFVGSFSRLFNFKTVIEVTRDLTRVGRKDIHFLIVGDGQQNDYLRNHTHEFKNIHLIGWSEKSIINKILAISSIGLASYSSVVAPALSNKPFEYMTAGIPVIASNFPLWEKIIKENNCGLTVDPLNHREIAKAVEYLMKHPDEAEKMGENGRKAVLEKYNWENESTKFLELYDTLGRSRYDR